MRIELTEKESGRGHCKGGSITRFNWRPLCSGTFRLVGHPATVFRYLGFWWPEICTEIEVGTKNFFNILRGIIPFLMYIVGRHGICPSLSIFFINCLTSLTVAKCHSNSTNSIAKIPPHGNFFKFGRSVPHLASLTIHHKVTD